MKIIRILSIKCYRIYSRYPLETIMKIDAYVSSRLSASFIRKSYRVIKALSIYVLGHTFFITEVYCRSKNCTWFCYLDGLKSKTKTSRRYIRLKISYFKSIGRIDNSITNKSETSLHKLWTYELFKQHWKDDLLENILNNLLRNKVYIYYILYACVYVQNGGLNTCLWIWTKTIHVDRWGHPITPETY